MTRTAWGASCFVLIFLFILIALYRSIDQPHRGTTELAGLVALELSDLGDTVSATDAIECLKLLGAQKFIEKTDDDKEYSASLWPNSWWNPTDSRVFVTLTFEDRKLKRYRLKVMSRSL